MLPLSLQTNVTSLFAQQQLETNNNAESNTIEQLTSGYRINNAGDDAAGLAVANELQANVTELQQGVINAANGSSILQIMDGGLSDISNLLDRLQTLATESASGTFEGDRTTLNNEYQSVLTEITREAGNIGLATGGTTSDTGTIGSSQYNTAALNVFIGGGNSDVATNDQVTIDLTSRRRGRCHRHGRGRRRTRFDRFGREQRGDATTALGLVQTAISDLGQRAGRGGRGRKPDELRHLARQLPDHQLDGFGSLHQGRQRRRRCLQPGAGADPAAVLHRRPGTGQLHAASGPEAAAVIARAKLKLRTIWADLTRLRPSSYLAEPEFAMSSATNPLSNALTSICASEQHHGIQHFCGGPASLGHTGAGDRRSSHAGSPGRSVHHQRGDQRTQHAGRPF